MKYVYILESSIPSISTSASPMICAPLAKHNAGESAHLEIRPWRSNLRRFSDKPSVAFEKYLKSAPAGAFAKKRL